MRIKHWQRFLPRGSTVMVLDAHLRRGIVIGHRPRCRSMLVRFYDEGIRSARWFSTRGQGSTWIAGWDSTEARAARAEDMLVR